MVNPCLEEGGLGGIIVAIVMLVLEWFRGRARKV
jgi:hypothetical protein